MVYFKNFLLNQLVLDIVGYKNIYNKKRYQTKRRFGQKYKGKTTYLLRVLQEKTIVFIPAPKSLKFSRHQAKCRFISKLPHLWLNKIINFLRLRINIKHLYIINIK